MKPIYGQFAAALALTFGLAACIPPAPEPTPAPSPAPVVTPTPAPTPTPAIQPPTYKNWIDAPRTAGDWNYLPSGTGSTAEFRAPDNTALFSMSCNRDQRRIAISRAGQSSGTVQMQIRTETADRTLEVSNMPSGVAALGASLAIGDPILDAMALTRGRFAVETAGLPTLYLPAWAEVTRVIEDCR